MAGALHAAARDSVARIGIDPVKRVFIAENHDASFYRWRDAEVRGRILVHVDAHHDTNAIAPGDPVTIANFVRAAIDAEFVRQVLWVVPDPSWRSSRARAAIRRHLAQIQSPIVTACPISDLPRFNEPVLLDIDVDYFVIPEVRHAAPDRHLKMPWRWPEELVDCLRAAEISTDLVTIAYSVCGGYTPLQWKYLGDELEWCLRRGDAPAARGGSKPMRDAALALQRGNANAAEQLYREAAAALEDSPAPLFHLAHLYAEAGRLNEGVDALRRALSIDRSYRTPYSAGLRLLQRGNLSAAERAYRRDLQLDPEDAFAVAGLGWLAARKQEWPDAERRLLQSLALNPRQLDVQRLLGRVYCKQRRWVEAERAYTRSISLALSGERSLDAPIVSDEGVAQPMDAGADPAHGDAYAELARLAWRRGDGESAIANLRISLAAGADGVRSRARLALLYLRQSRRREFLHEAGKALTMIPTDVSTAVTQATRRFRRRLTGAAPLLPPYSLD